MSKAPNLDELDIGASAVDPMEKFMADWSWQPDRQVVDPGYVYTEAERADWALVNAFGGQMLAVRPWLVAAYKGPEVKPTRIAG
jgi:hypothetical protein